MPRTYHCRDCPQGTVIEDHVYRVQRRERIHGTTGAVAGKLVAVDTLEGWDIYCAEHYRARKDRGEI